MSIRGAVIKKSSAQVGANYAAGTGIQTDGAIITWDGAVYDTHGFFTIGANTRLTVPSVYNGLYGIITCNLSLANITVASNLGLSILKNGAYQYIGAASKTVRSGDATAAGANDMWLSIRTAPILLATGDYFEARLVCNDASIDVHTESSFGIRILSSNTQTERCLVKKSADQTTANYSTISAVAWDAEIYDTSGIHDTVTNNTRLTIPSALNGKWGIVEASVTGNLFASTNYASLGIQRNGSRTYDGFGGNTATVGIATFGLVATTQPLQFSTNDYFESVLYLGDPSVTILAALSNFGLRVVEVATSSDGDGAADGQATVSGISPGTAVGLAQGFATAQASPPSHANADGIANVIGFSHAVSQAAGQADGFASVNGAAGVPAVGHADGFATVFSGIRPGGHAAILTAGI